LTLNVKKMYRYHYYDIDIFCFLVYFKLTAHCDHLRPLWERRPLRERRTFLPAASPDFLEPFLEPRLEPLREGMMASVTLRMRIYNIDLQY
jgi:hypothetical protein